MDQKVRSVGEVLSSLHGLTGHAWIVMDTGGGCEVFYSETFDAIITMDAQINYDREAGGVFDSSRDHEAWTFREEIANGEYELHDYDEATPWHYFRGTFYEDVWGVEDSTFSADTLTEILNYLEGSK